MRNETEKVALKSKLTTQLEMKNLGKLKYFFGIDVAYSKMRIFITQRKYVTSLLKETSGDVEPQEFLLKKSSEENTNVEKTQYPILVGKLVYLSHMRLDIAYAK